MKEFFSYDGLFLRILTKIGELIILNLLFLVCCVPIVTIGPAITSLYYAVVKSIRRDCGSPVKEFFSSMKRVMGRGVVFTLAFAALIAVLILVRDIAAEGEATVKPGLYICDFLFILIAAVLTYIFPVLSRFEVELGKMVRLSLSMSVRYWYFTVLIIGITGLLVFLVVNGVIPAPTVLFVPAVWCFLVSFPMEIALLKYMPAPEENETAWYYPTKDPEKEAAKAEREAKRREEREKARQMREKRRSEATKH